MEDQHVAVGIPEGGEVANTGIPGLGYELDPAGLELFASGGDIRNTQPDASLVGDEANGLTLGLPEAEGDIRRLDLPLRNVALGQTEHVPIPSDSPRSIPGRDGDEVNKLNLHALMLSRCLAAGFAGAKRGRTRAGKCAWQDSNLRPCAPEAHALSPELQALTAEENLRFALRFSSGTYSTRHGAELPDGEVATCRAVSYLP
jgi:hypothetical protein